MLSAVRNLGFLPLAVRRVARLAPSERLHPPRQGCPCFVRIPVEDCRSRGESLLLRGSMRRASMRRAGIDHLATIPGSEPRADDHLDAPHSQRYLLANGLPAAAAGEDDAAYALRLLAEQACESEDPPQSSGALGNQTVLSKRSARQQEANKQVWLARRAVQDPAPPLGCVTPPRRPAARALMGRCVRACCRRNSGTGTSGRRNLRRCRSSSTSWAAGCGRRRCVCVGGG